MTTIQRFLRTPQSLEVLFEHIKSRMKAHTDSYMHFRAEAREGTPLRTDFGLLAQSRNVSAYVDL